MEREKKIIDASVLVKVFSDEEDSEKAINLIERHGSGEIILTVPELLFLEVINALRYKNKDIEILKNANKDLWNFQFKIEKINSLILDRAIEISIKDNLTIYDSIYIALAQLNECELVTADKALYKSANVMPLKDIK